VPSAVIYCRVSTRDQVSNLSLSTQRTDCQAFGERRGYDVDRVFIEEGESAKTADRPQLQELLRYCRRRREEIDAVVVFDVSRWSRKTEDHLRYAPRSTRWA